MAIWKVRMWNTGESWMGTTRYVYSIEQLLGVISWTLFQHISIHFQSGE